MRGVVLVRVHHLSIRRLGTALLVVASFLIASSAMAQPGRGKGPMGKGPRSQKTDKGVETLTESNKPEVAAAIQKHVASMKQRVKDKQPIHLRDPLFAEVFRHTDKMKFV